MNAGTCIWDYTYWPLLEREPFSGGIFAATRNADIYGITTLSW
jgi:hypothetical protein